MINKKEYDEMTQEEIENEQERIEMLYEDELRYKIPND